MDEAGFNLLMSQGFLKWEARVLASAYSWEQLMEYPYFLKMRRGRAAHLARLEKLGYTERRKKNVIRRIYRKHGWETPLDMAREFSNREKGR